MAAGSACPGLFVLETALRTREANPPAISGGAAYASPCGAATAARTPAAKAHEIH